MLQETKEDHETEDNFPTCLQTENEIVRELVQILQGDKKGRFALGDELNKSQIDVQAYCNLVEL